MDVSALDGIGFRLCPCAFSVCQNTGLLTFLLRTFLVLDAFPTLVSFDKGGVLDVSFLRDEAFLVELPLQFIPDAFITLGYDESFPNLPYHREVGLCPGIRGSSEADSVVALEFEFFIGQDVPGLE